jgi:hypothetical protein
MKDAISLTQTQLPEFQRTRLAVKLAHMGGYAEAVWRYLEENCVELDLIPELQRSRALVVIRHHKFD